MDTLNVRCHRNYYHRKKSAILVELNNCLELIIKIIILVAQALLLYVIYCNNYN